jgi:hypothetical protein
VDKTEGKRPLGRHRPRWGEIVKWISRILEDMDWVSEESVWA